MRNILIVSSILIFLVSALNADILDIPEVKVYGERKIEVEPIKKQLLPFEKEYLQPSLINTKRGLPYFEVRDVSTIRLSTGESLFFPPQRQRPLLTNINSGQLPKGNKILTSS